MAATNPEELIPNVSANKEKSEKHKRKEHETNFYRCPITQEDLKGRKIVLGTDGILYSETGFKLLINNAGENLQSPLSRQPFPMLQGSLMPDRHRLYLSRERVVYAPGVMDIIEQSIELSTVAEMVRNAKNEKPPQEYAHLPEYYYPDDDDYSDEEASQQNSMQEDAESDIEEENDVSNNGNSAPLSVEISGQNNHHRYDRNRFFTPLYVESIPVLSGITCGIPPYCLVAETLTPKIGAALAFSCGGLACLVGALAGGVLLTIPAEIEANYQNSPMEMQNHPMEMEEDNGAGDRLLEEEERPGLFSRLFRG